MSRTQKMLNGIAAILMVSFFGLGRINAQPVSQNAKNFYEIDKEKKEYWENIPMEERKGWKQYRRWNYFWEQRLYPTGEFPNASKIMNDYYKSLNSKTYKNSTLGKNWTLIGPIDNPESQEVRNQGLGRINIVRIHPNNPLELWVGAATGGVWRTTDHGKTWTNFDFTQFMSLGVSDIAISPSNPNIIYVATGDADGSSASQEYFSVGIIKTTNGGQTWEATGYSSELSDRKLIGRLLIDPNNPDIVIAATKEGIIKTTDGGKKWVNKKSGLYFKDMEFKPNDKNVIYASTFSWSGSNYIYKSTDFGETWKEKIQIDGTVRLAIAVSPGNPDVIYSLNAAQSNSGFHSMYFSLDAGENWDAYAIGRVAGGSTANILGWSNGNTSDPRGQGMYDLCLAVNPKDPRIVYTGGVNIWRTPDQGSNWVLVSHWYGGLSKPMVHADIHDLVYSATGDTLYATHDGGIDFTRDGGASWKNITDGMSITQFYRIGTCEAKPDLIIAGAQDNGTSYRTNGKWLHGQAGDGMDCAIDPNNPSRLYASVYDGSFSRSTDAGKNFTTMVNASITKQSGAWVSPIAIDPNNTNVIYCGFTDLWKSDLYGDPSSWKKISNFQTGNTLRSIAVSPSNPNYIYCANLSTIWRTTNGGTNWTMIQSNSDASITSLSVHATNPEILYVSKSGYSIGNKIWKYDGTKWINLSGNLPNVPANWVVYQKNSPDRIYAATDVGVYFSDYGSNMWEKYNDGLPTMVVNELEINYATKKLRAGTWGRGVWEVDLVECNVAVPTIKVVGNTTICAGDSIVLEVETNASSYLWSTGETTKSIVVKKEGQYSLMIDDGNGCKGKSGVVSVVVISVPNLSLSADKEPGICEGDSITISANLGFASYKWSSGETTRKIVVKTPGAYACTATTKDGCSKTTEVINVTVNPKAEKPTLKNVDDVLVSTPAAKYRWYLNGKLIDTVKTQSYKPSKSGKYYVEVAESGDCYTKSDEIDYIVNSIVEYNPEFVSVSPNPSNGLFNVQFNNNISGNVEYVIYNATGAKVYSSEEYRAGDVYTKQFNLEEQASGIYMLVVKSHAKTFYVKLIKR